ncbi:MAG: hypothetical protein ACR2P6_07765, partial [Gammaproteobacteria bacterium]
LKRTAGICKKIRTLSAAALQAVEVGERARLGDSGAGVYLPTLAQVAEDLQRFPEVTAFVELKRQSLAVFGVDEMVEHVLAALHEVLEQCVFISFIKESLYEIRRTLPEHAVGLVLREWNDANRAAAEALKPEHLLVDHKKVLPGVSPWPGDWRWTCYDIVDPEQALTLHARGFDMISTFDIGGMIAALGNVETIR